VYARPAPRTRTSAAPERQVFRRRRRKRPSPTGARQLANATDGGTVKRGRQTFWLVLLDAPQRPRKRQTASSTVTTRLPFLATIRAGHKLYTVEVDRSGLRFVGWGDKTETHTDG
jgi:hypothetical protein